MKGVILFFLFLLYACSSRAATPGFGTYTCTHVPVNDAELQSFLESPPNERVICLAARTWTISYYCDIQHNLVIVGPETRQTDATCGMQPRNCPRLANFPQPGPGEAVLTAATTGNTIALALNPNVNVTIDGITWSATLGVAIALVYDFSESRSLLTVRNSVLLADELIFGTTKTFMEYNFFGCNTATCNTAHIEIYQTLSLSVVQYNYFLLGNKAIETWDFGGSLNIQFNTFATQYALFSEDGGYISLKGNLMLGSRVQTKNTSRIHENTFVAVPDSAIVIDTVNQDLQLDSNCYVHTKWATEITGITSSVNVAGSWHGSNYPYSNPEKNTSAPYVGTRAISRPEFTDFSSLENPYPSTRSPQFSPLIFCPSSSLSMSIQTTPYYLPGQVIQLSYEFSISQLLLDRGLDTSLFSQKGLDVALIELSSGTPVHSEQVTGAQQIPSSGTVIYSFTIPTTLNTSSTQGWVLQLSGGDSSEFTDITDKFCIINSSTPTNASFTFFPTPVGGIFTNPTLNFTVIIPALFTNVTVEFVRSVGNTTTLGTNLSSGTLTFLQNISDVVSPVSAMIRVTGIRACSGDTLTFSSENIIYSPCQCTIGSPCCDSSCQIMNTSTICRNSTGPCDVPEYCDGSKQTCPGDVFQPPSFVCRPSTARCDIAEVCGTSTSLCPPDKNFTADACGVCNGLGTSCTSQGTCGDSECNSQIGETCSTCPLDCGHCIRESECKNSNCRNGGSCSKFGTCVCQNNWNGPTCDNAISRTAFVAKNDSVEIKMDSVDPSHSASFLIAITRLREILPNGGEVISFDLSGLAFNKTKDIANDSISDQYTLSLSNGAYISLTFTKFSTTKDFEFANTTFSVAPDSLKLTMQIFYWPFANLANKLQVWTSLQSSQETTKDCKQVETDSNVSGNLRWLRYSINGSSLYAVYQQNAEIDGIPRALDIRNEGTNQVYFTLSHFWNFATIDPDFSILLDTLKEQKQNKCGKRSGLSRKHIIIIVVVIGSVALIAVAVLYYFRRKHERNVEKQLRPSNLVELE